MACLLAKLHRPEIDVRKPYTEIGSADAFSGRTYDEQYIASFVNEHNLPCNSTTAFLTPALRNRNIVLTSDVNLVGRPPELYRAALELLDEVHRGNVAANAMLVEIVRHLVKMRDQDKQKLGLLLSQFALHDETAALSAEGIIMLITSHMTLPKTSRLPTLIVAAAYQAASLALGEQALPLHHHAAADKQTGALGDVEIRLATENAIIASYEIKDKQVTKNDIDAAIAKVNAYFGQTGKRIEHYVFVTTEPIEQLVKDYAASLYIATHGIEFAILDCVGFLRHFLHLFHHIRMQFLEAYQELLLAEPDSAVNHALKEAFLAARIAAEAGLNE